MKCPFRKEIITTETSKVFEPVNGTTRYSTKTTEEFAECHYSLCPHYDYQWFTEKPICKRKK